MDGVQLTTSYELESGHRKSSLNSNTAGYCVPVYVVVQIHMYISLNRGIKSVYKKAYSKVEIITNKVDRKNKLNWKVKT